MPLAVPAAPGTQWTTLSPGGIVDAGYASGCGPKPVLVDAAGNSVLVRILTARDGLFLSIAKFTPAGDLAWRYDDIDLPREHFFPYGGACSAALDAAGNVVVASAGARFHEYGYRHLVTAKHSAVDGAPLWQVHSDTIGGVDIRAVAVDAEGDVWTMARGTRPSPPFSWDTVIVKYQGDTGAPVWTSRPDGVVRELTGYSMLALDAQGDAVAATTSVAEKFDGTNGDTLWTVPVPDGPLGAHRVADGLAIDPAGDVLLLKGEIVTELETSPNTTRTMRDYATVKLSGATGAPLWSGQPSSIARYDGPAQRDDMPGGLALDAAGNVFVHGMSQAGGHENQHYDFATLKLDGATGAPSWSGMPAGAARYNGPGNARDRGRAVAVDATGDVFVTGASGNASGDEDILTRKHSGTTGAPLWAALPDFANVHDGAKHSFDSGEGVAVGPDGDAFVMGREAGAWNDNQVLLRLDGANGSTEWTARSEPDVARVETVLGTQIRSLALDAAGNAYVLGASFNGNCSDWLLMKAAPDGTRLWTRSFGAARTAFEFGCGDPYALALDGDGDVFVTGTLAGKAATAKFSGVDGTPLWTGLAEAIAYFDEPRYSGYAGRLIAVDSHGDVVVAIGPAAYDNLFSSRSLYTLKYDGDSGAKLWAGRHGAQEYFSRSNADVTATGLAIDAEDHVVVSASTTTNSGFDSSATIKYDGGTGLPLWTGLVDGAAIVSCDGPRLALDPAGNPVIGCSDWYGGQSDFLVIKYAAATGLPMWSGDYITGAVSYSGPGNGYDYVRAIAINRQGDIYVTGSSEGSDGETDRATVKFSGVDGTPRWPGVARREDQPDLELGTSELAVVGDGTVAVAAQTRYFPHQAPTAPGSWSLLDARSGAVLHTQTMPALTTVNGILQAIDGDLRMAGTAQASDAPTLYVSRIADLPLPLFRSGFEAGE